MSWVAHGFGCGGRESGTDSSPSPLKRWATHKKVRAADPTWKWMMVLERNKIGLWVHVVALMALMVLAVGAHAQDKPPPAKEQTQPATEEVGEVEEESPGSKTAEELLRALRRGRPITDVIAPASQAARSKADDRPLLLPEGAMVVDRIGTVRKGDPLWLFTPTSGEQAVKVLPNSNLEMMVRTTAGTTLPVEFSVSGEVTVFQAENHLLVRSAKRSVVSAVPVAVPEASVATVADDTLPATAEDVLSALQKKAPSHSPLVVRDEPSEQSSDDDGDRGGVGQKLLPDGAPLVHRPGRLTRDGHWWMFAFESDDPEHSEPPMRILPNQSLELMLQALNLGEHGLVFAVSGEVTLFKGRNYLLPRVALRRMDSGNTRK